MEQLLPTILKNSEITVFSHSLNDLTIFYTNDTLIGNFLKENSFSTFLGKYKNDYLAVISQQDFDFMFPSEFGIIKIVGKQVDNTIQGILHLLQENACEKKIKILYDAIEEGILIHEHGVFKEANEVLYRVSGYSKNELLNRNLLQENIFQLSKEVIQEMIANIIAKKEEFHYKNVKMFTKSGEIKYVSMTSKKLKDEMRVLVIQDVTESFLLQQHLEKSKKHFKEITEHSSDVIFTCNFNTQEITYITPSITFLTDFQLDEFKGKQFEDYLHEDDKEMFSLIIQEAKKSIKKTIPIVFARICKKGVFDEEKKWIYVEALVTFIDEENYVINMRDIGPRLEFEKERTRLEAELHHAKKMQTIGTLAGGIAHDFKNILMPIIGYANMITYDLDPVQFANVIQDLQKIIMAAERANELVNQILTFSHKTEIEKKVISFDELLNNTVSLLRASITTSVEFIVNNEVKNAAIKANYTQIQQVLINICTNAAHAMNNKGPVKIMVREIKIRGTLIQRFGKLYTGDYITISIEDKGHGISPENIERIFDPFFTTKDIGKGTGLGLSVAQGIINNHSGLIHVTSKINKGTIFEIFLPIFYDTAESEMKNNVTSSINREFYKEGKGRILFIDDEEMTRDLVTRILQRAGYDVKAMKDGREALRELSKNTAYDLIITDQSMPKITGLEIARKAKLIIRDIPVILISGSAELLKIDTKKLGIDEFAMKPVIPNDLLKMVSKHL